MAGATPQRMDTPTAIGAMTANRRVEVMKGIETLSVDERNSTIDRTHKASIRSIQTTLDLVRPARLWSACGAQDLHRRLAVPGFVRGGEPPEVSEAPAVRDRRDSAAGGIRGQQIPVRTA